MKLFKTAFAFVLCACLCLCLSSCQNKRSSSRSDDYLAGVDQGEIDSFIDLWDSNYNGNVRTCGNIWETDSFSLVITAKRGSMVDSNVVGNEKEPYIEIDFSLHEGTIEEHWKDNNILFYIYSYDKEGYTKIWSSDDYYWYFYLQGDDVVGSKESAETKIYEGTERLDVLIVINGSVYAASYSVDI